MSAFKLPLKRLDPRMKRRSKAELTPRQIYERLSAPLPEAAYEYREDGMTAIIPAYRAERMNQILGPDGWLPSKPEIVSLEILKNAAGEVICSDEGLPVWEAAVSCSVTIPALKKTYYGFGGWTNADKGDALKGATTDAIGKALSDLIGIEVYKGLRNQPANGNRHKGEWLTGTLDAAYFSFDPPTATISGERMHLSPGVVKRFQKLWAAQDQRQDSGAGPIVKVQWEVSPLDSELKWIVGVSTS